MRILFIGFLACVFWGCASPENGNTSSNNSNKNTSSPSPAIQPSAEKQKAISPDGLIFESLTADSNYFDAVKLLGTPHAENDLPELKSPIPVLLAFYQQNACVVFMNKDKPQEKGIKSNYKYIGALKIQPPEILHSAEPKNLDFLEVTRTVVIKKLLQDAEKEVKQEKK